MGQTPFWLVSSTKAIIPMEYIVLSLKIVALTSMIDCKALEERLAQLEELKDEWFLVGFH